MSWIIFDRVGRRHWMLLAGFLGLLCAATQGSQGCATGASPETKLCCQQKTSAAQELREKWGIEIASLRLSAQGYFVDFRYKVIDPAKAAPLADKQFRPYLIDVASGKELRVPTTPKLGSLRQTAQALVAGNIYFMFFGNRSGVIKSGSKVTVVIGDCRLENLNVG